MRESTLPVNPAFVPIPLWADIPIPVILPRRPSGHAQYLVDRLAA